MKWFNAFHVPHKKSFSAESKAPGSGRRIAVTLIVASLAGVLSVVLPATPAAAASCANPTFKVYPGSSNGARYAEVRFELHGCYSESTSSWWGTVDGWHINGTGQALQYKIKSVAISTISATSSIKTWKGTIKAAWCPFVVGCGGELVYTVTMTLSKNYQTGAVNYWMGTRTWPTGGGLYTTP